MPSSWYLWKALDELGVSNHSQTFWFETVWSYGVKAVDY